MSLGKVTTYKELAKAIGHPGAFRAVGTALRKNPFAPTVPCHRVVASNLSLGGFQGSKDPNGPNLKRKVRMLKEEGVHIDLDLTEEEEKEKEKEKVKRAKKEKEEEQEETQSTKRLKITESDVYIFP